MPRIELRLFGAPELLRDGQPVRPHSVRALALLAFVAVEHDRPHAREKLASLFWPEATEAAGRQSLRQALYSIRGLAEGIDGWLDAGKEWVRLRPHAEIAIDVQRFSAAVEASDADRWAEAARLYRAPLLAEGVSVVGEAFSEWLEAARERLHAMAIHNLDRLLLARVAQRDWGSARELGEALRALDPLRESTSRHLLRIADAIGDAPAIEGEWARLTTVLRRELGIAPSEQTAALYRALRQGGCPTPATAPPEPHSFAGAPDRTVLGALRRAARAAERVYAFGHAHDLYAHALAILERSGTEDPMARCEILFAKEAVLERLGRRTEQMANIAALLAAARSLDDPVRFAQALLREASAAAYAGDTDRAIRAATQALETFRGAHDAPGEAEALRELGFVHWRAGDFPGALARVREALTLHRQLGDVGGEATALHNLAEIHRSLGSPQRALEWYGQAIELHWAAGNRNGEILTAFGMANALLQAGNEVLACEKYAHALALSERYGERTMQSRALHALAMRGKSAGDLDEAMRCMQRAVEVDRAINYAHALGHDLVDLGLLHALRNERSQARAALEEAAVWFDLTGDEAGVGATRAHLADLESGRVPQAHERGDHGVKSHLPLSEGKVYCEFESPFSRASQRTG